MNLLGMKRKLLPLGSPQGGKGGGGGSAPPPSSQTVTNTSIPEYARPYVETMLGQSSALTDINQNPYQLYGGQRIAEFSPLQQQAFGNITNMQSAGQLGTGTDLATQAGYGGLSASGQVPGLQSAALNYGQAGSMYGSAGAGQALNQSLQAQRQAQMYGGMGAMYGGQAAGLAPQAQQYGQTASNIGLGGLGFGALGAGYGEQAAQAAQMGYGAGSQFAQQATDPNAMRAYMSPYMQNAVDLQKQEAIRDFDIGRQAQKARAVGSGAFGGSRQAIAESEAQRNLNTQLQGIQATGTQKAFEDAQRQQQFGANLGLQGLQAGYQGTGMGIQGAGMGLQGIGTAMQGQQAGLAGLGQAGSLFGQGMQGAGVGLSGVGQQLGAGQLGLSGAQTGMQGAQSGLQGIQGAIGAGQYGLQGLGTAGSAAGTLGQLGQTQYGQQMGINQAQQTAGAVQQAQAQQALDIPYQDFLSQKNYPYQQLAFMSDMLRGLPLSQSAQTQYTAPPSLASQLGGAGMSALGMYGMSGGFRAKGGMVGKGHANGGLMAAKAYKEGGYANGGDISMMSTEQLTKMLDNPSLTPMEVSMIQKQLMLRRRMEMNPETPQIMAQAMRSGIGSIPTGDMVPEEGMAGGGIVAFAKGGKSEESYQQFLENQVRKSIENQMSGDAFARSEAEKAKLEQAIAARQERAPYEALAMAGLGTMAGTSQYGLTNLGLGATEGLKSYSKSKAADTTDRQKMLEQQVIADKAEDARRSGLTGQMQTTLGQMYNRQAATAAAAGGKEDRNIQRAAALINSDPVIKSLTKQLENSGYQPGSPEYEYFEKRIVERQNQIYKTLDVVVPEVTPSALTFPKPEEKPGFFSRMLGGSKPAAPQNKVVPFNQLPN